MKRVLCIDDIAENLFTIKALFDSYHSDKYEILTAQSGKDALEILLTKKVDIILLDVMMPELDGYETAKLIQKNKKTANIPIIFVTAKKDNDTITNCYVAGGADYLSKPYNEQELFMRVAFHLKLKDDEKKLIYEKKLAQDILNLQDNMIAVTDGNKPIVANQALFDFFKVKDLDEFIEKFGCICQNFLKDEHYFNLDKIDKGSFWIDVLIGRLESRECSVMMMDLSKLKPRSFAIKAKKIDDNYLISFTDITSITIESNEYKHDAFHDNLTQIYNRNKLNAIIPQFLNNIGTSYDKFSFILFDIDHFKQVNDIYGHLAGDSVLKQLSQIVKSHIRDNDIFARWGGEEFVILLPNISADKAKDISEYLRGIIEVENFEVVGNITCSFGVSEYKVGDTQEKLMKKADDALYKAKENGRNQVVCQ